MTQSVGRPLLIVVHALPGGGGVVATTAAHRDVVAAVDDGGLGGAVGVVEEAEGALRPGVGEVDGGLHPAAAAAGPRRLDLAPAIRPVRRAPVVAELALVVCN